MWPKGPWNAFLSVYDQRHEQLVLARFHNLGSHERAKSKLYEYVSGSRFTKHLILLFR